MVFMDVLKKNMADKLAQELIFGELGESTVEPTVGDTSLGSPISGTSKQLNVNVVNGVVSWKYVRGINDPAGDLAEFGIFNGGGQLVLHVGHTVIPVTTGNNIQVVYSGRAYFV